MEPIGRLMPRPMRRATPRTRRQPTSVPQVTTISLRLSLRPVHPGLELGPGSRGPPGARPGEGGGELRGAIRSICSFIMIWSRAVLSATVRSSAAGVGRGRGLQRAGSSASLAAILERGVDCFSRSALVLLDPLDLAERDVERRRGRRPPARAAKVSRNELMSLVHSKKAFRAFEILKAEFMSPWSRAVVSIFCRAPVISRGGGRQRPRARPWPGAGARVASTTRLEGVVVLAEEALGGRPAGRPRPGIDDALLRRPRSRRPAPVLALVVGVDARRRARRRGTRSPAFSGASIALSRGWPRHVGLLGARRVEAPNFRPEAPRAR